MSQRIALFLSIGLTAFVLVIIGGAIAVAQGAQAVAAQSTLDPQLVAQLQTREAAYRAMVEQANALLQTETPTATGAPAPAVEPTAAYPISPEMAVYIAQSVAPSAALLKPPELVNYRGVIAYEVVFSTGRIFVDANTGAILWNGAAQNAGGPGYRGGDEYEADD